MTTIHNERETLESIMARACRFRDIFGSGSVDLSLSFLDGTNGSVYLLDITVHAFGKSFAATYTNAEGVTKCPMSNLEVELFQLLTDAQRATGQMVAPPSDLPTAE